MGTTSLFSKRPIEYLKTAHEAGIFTWVSLEPVINPGQALEVIKIANEYVDFWKVGKLNHMKEYESRVDWKKFLFDTISLLNKLGTRYYIKKDLIAFDTNLKAACRN
jgi:hypothetical protein